jgi:acetyl esterase/lipase
VTATDPRDVLTRPAPPPDLTLRYGEHPDHVADVRFPPGGRGPLVVFVHGGFWRAAFDRAHSGPLAADLAARGYVAATVEFRRVGQPGGGWPGTLDDVAAAVTALPGLLERPGDRPVLAGHSAGGHLALWLAGRSPELVRGVLALAPVADLALAHARGLGDGAVAELLGGGPDEVPARYAAADPAARGPLVVPATIVHGDRDDRVPIEVSRAYADRTGGGVRLVELAGVEHFGVIDPLSSAWPAVLAALRDLAPELSGGIDDQSERR